MKPLIQASIAITLNWIFCAGSIAQTPVTVVSVDDRSFTRSLQLNANLVAFNEVELASEVTAKVEDLLFEAGDQIEEKQLLLKIDDTEQALLVKQSRAVLERLEAEVKLADLDKKRLSKLLKSKSVSQEQYDRAIAKTQQAIADVKAQQAEIQLAENTLDKYAIRAPFAGVITTRLVDKGTLLRPGELIAQLTATHPLKVELGVPQRYFGSIQPGARITLSFANSSSDSVSTELTVERVVNRANDNRLFTAWGRLDNQSRQWLPGMSVKATLSWESRSENSFVVPSDSLIQTANGFYSLWKITKTGNNEGTAQSIAVTVNSRQGVLASVSAAITNELQQGDLIVVSGNESLQADQQVVINSGNL